MQSNRLFPLTLLPSLKGDIACLQRYKKDNFKKFDVKKMIFVAFIIVQIYIYVLTINFYTEIVIILLPSFLVIANTSLYTLTYLYLESKWPE